eukprot:scaffold21438_cov60-Cyclotella_meneghiniana.AAC.6
MDAMVHLDGFAMASCGWRAPHHSPLPFGTAKARDSQVKGDVGVGGCVALGGSSVLPPPIRNVGRRSMATANVDLG